MTTRAAHAARSGRYREVSALAVASVVLGLLSVTTALHWLLGIIPAVGIVLGYLARRWVDKAPEERTGGATAMAGIFLSLFFWTVGSGWLMMSRAKEVPFGYEEVTYEMLQPNPELPAEKVPPEVLRLEDKKVFIKAFMAPTRQQVQLKQFVACPVIANCSFCTPDPKPTEMILVSLQGDLRTDYTTRMVHLGGRFHVDPDAPNGLPYRIEADYMR